MDHCFGLFRKNEIKIIENSSTIIRTLLAQKTLLCLGLLMHEVVVHRFYCWHQQVVSLKETFGGLILHLQILTPDPQSLNKNLRNWCIIQFSFLYNNSSFLAAVTPLLHVGVTEACDNH